MVCISQAPDFHTIYSVISLIKSEKNKCSTLKKKARVRETVISILTGCTVFGLVAVPLSWLMSEGGSIQLWLLGSGLILGGLVGLLCGLTHQGLKSCRNRLIRILLEGSFGLVYGYALGAITYGTLVILDDDCFFSVCMRAFAPLFASIGGLVCCILGGAVGLILSELL
jgi:hypothetical protein